MSKSQTDVLINAENCLTLQKCLLKDLPYRSSLCRSVSSSRNRTQPTDVWLGSEENCEINCESNLRTNLSGLCTEMPTCTIIQGVSHIAWSVPVKSETVKVPAMHTICQVHDLFLCGWLDNDRWCLILLPFHGCFTVGEKRNW